MLSGRCSPRHIVCIAAVALLAFAVPRAAFACPAGSKDVVFFALTGSPTAGESSDAPMRALDEQGITDPIDRVFEEVTRSGAKGWREIVSDILSGKGIDFKEIGASLVRGALGDLLSAVGILGKIMLIGVAVASLEILSETVSPNGSNKIAIWACHIALVLLAVFSFKDVLGIARGAMDALRTAFFALIPALTGLSLVSAAPVTATVLHPLVFGMGTVASVFILDLAFPLIYTSVALDLGGNLGGGDRAGGVAAMLRQVAFLATGVVMSAFVGVVVGQRAAAGLADGVAYRTAKYVSSTFIPIAGKAIGDTMDMFFVSAYGLRAAIGIAGSIGLFGLAFSPLLKVLSCLLVWKVSAAFLGPLVGKSVSRSLKAMADGIAFLAVSLFATTFVFIICLSLVAQAARPL